MAVTVTSTISGPYIPNGATTVFAFDFKAGSADEIQVYRDTGDEWDLIPGADYTVSVDPDQEGGDVEFSVAPSNGSGDIYIVSEPLFTREGQYTGEGPFTPKGLNNQFDRAAVRDLALARDVGRSIKVPLGEEPTILPRAGDRALKYLAFDADGLPLPVSAVIDLVLNEALGLPVGSTNMGDTPGNVYSNNGTAKEWFEEGEAAIEAFYSHASNKGAGLVGWLRSSTYLAGTVGNKLLEIRSIRDYGAKCDGVTDDSDAWDAAIADLPNNARGGALYVPGPTRITRKISIVEKGLALYGNGVTSDVLCDSLAASIDWQSTSNTDAIATVPQFMSDGVWFTKTYAPAGAESGGTAISLKWSGTGTIAGTPHGSMSRGGIRALDGTRYWNKALEIIDGGAMRFTDFTLSNFNGVDLSKTTAAISIKRVAALNCCRFQFTNCYAFRFQRGIYAQQVGAVQNGSIEAIYWTGGEIVGARYGFESDVPAGPSFFSQFQFINAHMDVTGGFVKAAGGINNLKIVGNFLIKSANGEVPGDSKGFDIPGGVFAGSILANHIIQYDKNYGTGASEAISISSSGTPPAGLVIFGNRIASWAVGIRIANALSKDDAIIGRNSFYNCTSDVIAPDIIQAGYVGGFDAFSIVEGANTAARRFKDGNAASGSRSLEMRWGDGALYQRRMADDFSAALSEVRCDLLEASATWDPPNTANGAQNYININVPGAVVGDYARASASVPLADAFLTAEVTSAGNARVYLHVMTGGSVDIGNMTVYVRVEKR